MKLFCILSLITLSRCTQSSSAALTIADGGVEGNQRYHRQLPDHYDDMDEDEHEDEHDGGMIRGFKASKKGKGGRPDVPISIVEGPAYHELEDYHDDGKGGGKGSKSSKQSGGSRSSKKSKKGKSSKKKIAKKLKHPDYEDDDYYYESVVPSPAPSVNAGDLSEFPTSIGDTGSLPPTFSGSLIDPVMMTLAPLRTRSGFSGLVPDNALRTRNGPDDRTQPNINEGVPFDFPLIERTLYPAPISLKAHSSIDISERETEIFEILQLVLTPYLRTTAGPILKKYNLEVTYSEGPDTSSLGVIVTNIDLTCTMVIESSSKDDLVNISHETAEGWIRDFFDGPDLFSLLGDLRQNGVDVNEIVFLEDEFQSGLFTGDAVAAVTTTGSRNSSPSLEGDSKNRAGLFVSLFVGVFVVSAALFVHFRGSHFEEVRGSIRWPFGGGSDSGSHSSAHDSQSSGPDKEVAKTRQRSWSGSFRRHPPGGVKPAAIQKQPAFSNTFLKEETTPGKNPEHTLTFHDDQSYSVAGGDYNVPEEYDFKASPTPPTPSTRASGSQQNRFRDEEFSMPDDYNTVTDEYSLYSQSVRGNRRNSRISRPSPRAANPFDYGSPSQRRGGAHSHAPSPFGSPAASSRRSPGQSSIPLQMTSPTSGQYIDEWSVDSYSTPSPNSKQNSVPYRDWHDAPSPRRSQLDMPPLA